MLLTARRGATTARVAAVAQLKAMIVGAPEELRAELRGRPPGPDPHLRELAPAADQVAGEHRATVRALHATAQRIQFLQAEEDQLQAELSILVRAVAPWLLEVPLVSAR